MRWEYIYIDKEEVMMMSGWKLYVYGETERDGRIAGNMVLPVCHFYNLTTKIATQSIIRRNRDKTIAWAPTVIYIRPSVNLSQLIKDLSEALSSYCREGKIVGAKTLNSKLHYRYDCYLPLSYEVGVDYDTYLTLYRGEYGDYNILNNLNPFYNR